MKKPTAKKRILIVEDDPEMLETFALLLASEGYEVIQAEYALPALFRVVDSQPDLILADLNMPMMNGLELIEQFKSHLDTCDIPVVVVTGSDSEETRREAFRVGCAGYLTKPMAPKAFLAEVKKFLKPAKPAKP